MLTLQVGQTADLVFTPRAVGVDPARVRQTRWMRVAPNTFVTLTSPNHVTGMSVGLQPYKVAVTIEPTDVTAANDQITYEFTIECVPAGAAPVPVVVPVALDNVVTPSAP